MAINLDELVEKIRQERPPKSQLKRLIEKAVRHLPGRERNRQRAQVAQQLGFKSWKQLSDNWLP